MAARRVVHAIASNFLGGPERQLLGHAKAADPAKWEIILASFPERGEEPAFLSAARREGIRTALIPVRGAYDPCAPWRIARSLHELRADLLCAHGYRMAILGPVAARVAGIPLISVWRGWTWENAKVRALQALGCAALRLADRVIAVSHDMARRLGTVPPWTVPGGYSPGFPAESRDSPMGAGIPRGKLTVVWNAIDAAELPHASRELQDQVRAELGLPGGAPPFDRLRAGSAGGSPVLVSVGRLSPEKGHAVLLQAMPGIIARYPQAVLLVVGSGRQADRLRVLAARLGLEPSVRFLGHRSDARHIMAGADLLILPSLSEGLPNVVLEAMAMGLPVVATQVGGVAEVLAGGDAGWIIQPGDARALAGGVCAALGDDRRRDEMSVKAQELVRREFTFEKQALRFERVYESVLTSPRT